MDITPREAKDVQVMMRSNAWKIYQSFLQDYHNSIVASLGVPPSGIEQIIEREQRLGYIGLSANVLSNFEYEITATAKEEPHHNEDN